MLVSCCCDELVVGGESDMDVLGVLLSTPSCGVCCIAGWISTSSIVELLVGFASESFVSSGSFIGVLPISVGVVGDSDNPLSGLVLVE